MLRAEKAYLKQRVEELSRQKTNSRKEPMLPHGPLGNISGGKGYVRKRIQNARGGLKMVKKPIPVSSADGQNVSYQNKIPFIDDPESPYHEMALAHYKKMAKQWKKDMGITLSQLREKRDQIHRKRCKEATEAGKQPPTKKLVVTHNKVPRWMNRLGITKADWPDWPKEAKPISEMEL